MSCRAQSRHLATNRNCFLIEARFLRSLRSVGMTKRGVVLQSGIKVSGTFSWSPPRPQCGLELETVSSCGIPSLITKWCSSLDAVSYAVQVRRVQRRMNQSGPIRWQLHRSATQNDVGFPTLAHCKARPRPLTSVPDQFGPDGIGLNISQHAQVVWITLDRKALVSALI